MRSTSSTETVRAIGEAKRPRVFGIGFHKTGTTSVARALERLGYGTVHGAGPLRAALGHYPMMDLLRAGQLGPVWKVAAAFDAFADNPWFSLFREADARFPGSRFILTRRDPERWLRSVLNHFGGTESDFRRWIYGVGDPVGNELVVLERYRAHEAAVLTHFAHRPEDLLVMDFEQGDGWDELCGFLGLAVPDEAFPHENRRSPSRAHSGIRAWVQRRLRDPERMGPQR
jgi:hypothetical protein